MSLSILLGRNDKYMQVTATTMGTRIDVGLLDTEEALDVARELISTGQELLEWSVEQAKKEKNK